MQGVAFFDMDHTLVAANTGRVYAEHLYRTGRLSVGQVARVAALLVGYRLSLVDLSAVMERMIATLAGVPEAPMLADCAELFERAVQGSLYEDAVALVEEHRARGDKVVIISASTPYMVRPLATHLAMDGWLCTRPAVDSDGLFTGAYEPPLCYGAGKVAWAGRWCAEHGLTLDASTFYTDSFSDVPLLAAVGRPFVVNPDLRLRAAAKRRGWPSLRFRRTVGQPGEAGGHAARPVKESE